MTSPNTGPQPTIPTELPTEVLRNWHDSFTALQRAEQIKAQLPALDEELARVQARLDFLKGEHQRAGRDITAAYTSSETSREMAELWCTKHGRPLPPEPDLVTINAGNGNGNGQYALPAAPERDAGAEPPLGLGVAGETTTQTVIDPEGGGDLSESSDLFQPPNGRNGRGESRA
ncbi:hypothetical protein [Actinomadura sp. GTD37]|uniref:hypothetical protein n=1 Tax=Actinomadura sp. GTD37 TaxID=1778030 RepID=UPI0035C00B71